MPKFFVFSDIDGFYGEFLNSLSFYGYNPQDENHWLIGCGNYFGKGSEPVELMEFLMNSERVILIRGSNEELMEEMIERGYAVEEDMETGIFNTLLNFDKSQEKTQKFGEAFGHKIYKKIKPFYDEMGYYFETENYIFCHSWIPTKFNERDRTASYLQRWRSCELKDWSDAVWANPYKKAAQGLNKTGKIIVSGHWHCSEYWAKRERRTVFGPDARWTISVDKENGHIGINACTERTKRVNIFVVEDNFIEQEVKKDDCLCM